MHSFEKVNTLSINLNEISFYQDGDKWEHNLIPIEISKNESDKVIDLIFYKNPYALIKKLHVFLGKYNKSSVCRQCSKSYTNESTLKNHKEKCREDNMCTMRTSSESQLYWKKHVPKHPLFFKIVADFEADNEIDNSNTCKKTTSIYKQNPILNGYYILSELEDVFKIGYYEFLLGYNNFDWFVKEVITLEKTMAFFFKNTKKDIIMKKMKKLLIIITSVGSVKKIINLIKFVIIVT